MSRSHRSLTSGALLLLILSVPLAVANLAGPPVGSSGAPGGPNVSPDRTCNQAGCHTGNTNNNPQGRVSLEGLPRLYTPGTTYDFLLQLQSSSTAGAGNRRWGFQITAIRMDTGTRAGTWTIRSDQLLRPNNAKQRDYLSHNASGVRQGTPSPSAWDLTWTAPAGDVGPVGFFYTGNAANGTGTSLGDFIYVARDTMFPDGVAVEPMTWGRVKRTDWEAWHP